MTSAMAEKRIGGENPGRVSASIVTAIDAAVLLAFSSAIYWFAKKQEIWVDETTQLSGITLKFGDMLRWLSGHDVGRFGVPSDRMPPVSYILDWTWLRLFGPSDLGFRLFHAAFLVGGVVLLVATARRHLGLAASFVTLTVLCLSPKLIGMAVEIRAYPMFFFLSAVQTIIFLRLLNNRTAIDRKLLAAFAIVSLMSIYTHFFGIMSSSSFFLVLALAYARYPRPLIEIILAFVMTAIGSLGVLPFVFSAVAGSKPGISVEHAADSQHYLRYLLELIGDSANLISSLALFLFLGGAAALFVISTIGATRRLLGGDSKPTDWLLLVVIAGASAALMASLLAHGFDPLKASYSIWIVAPLALFLSSGAIAPNELLQWKSVYGIAFAATLTGAAVSTYGFLAHASEFVHGPGEFVNALYDRTASPKAIVYESGAAWGWSYFPLVFLHNGDVAQFRSVDGSDLARIVSGSSQPDPQRIVDAVAPLNNLVLVDIRLRTYQDIRRCDEDACPQFREGEVEAALEASGWRAIAIERQFGLYDTQVKLFRRN